MDLFVCCVVKPPFSLYDSCHTIQPWAAEAVCFGLESWSRGSLVTSVSCCFMFLSLSLRLSHPLSIQNNPLHLWIYKLVSIWSCEGIWKMYSFTFAVVWVLVRLGVRVKLTIWFRFGSHNNSGLLQVWSYFYGFAIIGFDNIAFIGFIAEIGNTMTKKGLVVNHWNWAPVKYNDLCKNVLR